MGVSDIHIILRFIFVWLYGLYSRKCDTVKLSIAQIQYKRGYIKDRSKRKRKIKEEYIRQMAPVTVRCQNCAAGTMTCQSFKAFSVPSMPPFHSHMQDRQTFTQDSV